MSEYKFDFDELWCPKCNMGEGLELVCISKAYIRMDGSSVSCNVEEGVVDEVSIDEWGEADHIDYGDDLGEEYVCLHCGELVDLEESVRLTIKNKLICDLAGI